MAYPVSPLAVVATDQHERVTMWNPAAERMFGAGGVSVEAV
ncbi:MAG TPA: PAS domain-containing protein [Gemmatimonadaceae bacterium]|nr:PAS domain-containing protein [Gemmatimonadaceae bacterium]